MAGFMSKLKNLGGNRGRVNYGILVTTLLLVVFGMVMLFSASFYYGLNRYGDSYYFIKKQIIGAVIGGAAMFVLSIIDYRKWLKLWVPIYIAGLILLVLVWVPGIGTTANEASRWIVIPGINLSIQPSEITKYTLVIAVAACVSKFGEQRMQSFTAGVVPILLLMAPIALMLLLQPNFSMLVSLAITCFFMLMMSGVRWMQLGLMVGAGLGAGSVLMFAADYRADRISGFLDPWNDTNAHQLRQSLIAFGSGGMWGKGLGSSRQKFLFLPYGESDMIFAIIAEELGLVGASLLVIAYLVLFVQCYRVSMRCKDKGGTLLVAGCTTFLAFQTAMNMGVATGLLPTTGQTLPFISAGATSIIVCMAVIGIILSVSRECR